MWGRPVWGRPHRLECRLGLQVLGRRTRRLHRTRSASVWATDSACLDAHTPAARTPARTLLQTARWAPLGAIQGKEDVPLLYLVIGSAVCHSHLYAPGCHSLARCGPEGRVPVRSSRAEAICCRLSAGRCRPSLPRRTRCGHRPMHTSRLRHMSLRSTQTRSGRPLRCRMCASSRS